MKSLKKSSKKDSSFGIEKVVESMNLVFNLISVHLLAKTALLS